MRLNLVLLLFLAASVGANLAVHHDPTRPNFEYLPEMVHSIPYDSFAANPNFADGKTLQAPVAGTIPKGVRPLHFGPTPADALRAGEELKQPLAGEAALERGAFVFQNFCLPCHGPAGKGDGPVAQRSPLSQSLITEKAAKLKDGQMFHILTYGQNQQKMPSYASQLSESDRWRVIAYVRSLQRSLRP